MAGNGVIFFTLGTLFGGLCSAAVAVSWPTVPQTLVNTTTPTKLAKSAAGSKSRGVAPFAARSKVEHAPWLTALARPLLTPSPMMETQEDGSDRRLVEQVRQATHDIEEQDEWTPEQERAFYEQEKNAHQARQERIETMRQDLVRQAKLDPQERNEFLQLVQDITQKLVDGERELNEILGPMPLVDPGESDQEQEDPPRLALLQNDFERSKALLSAQTRFEALLGPERLEALGPQFQSVEAFIKDGPLWDPADSPIKGEHAPGSIR